MLDLHWNNQLKVNEINTYLDKNHKELETNEYTVNFYGTKGSMSNSDYKSFKCGIGLMTCGKKKFIGFCTPRIHTKRDIIANVENIEFITDNLTNFINNI